MLFATQPNTSEICPENVTTNRAIKDYYHSFSTLHLKSTGTVFTRSPITYISDYYYLDLIVSRSFAKYSKISIDLPLTKQLDDLKSLTRTVRWRSFVIFQVIK